MKTEILLRIGVVVWLLLIGSQGQGSYGLLSELVAAGEVAAGVVLVSTVETLKRNKRAPIDWENAIDPMLASVVALHLLAKAPHPNAARLFIDFFLSEEAQQFLVTMNRIPARIDIKPKNANLDPSKLEIVVISPELSDRFERYSQDFRQIFLSKR